MELYAEISRKMVVFLDTDYDLNFPEGVTYKRKIGSRSVVIDIEDETLLTEIQDLLDEAGISFQEERDEEEDRRAAKKEKLEEKKRNRYVNVNYGVKL